MNWILIFLLIEVTTDVNIGKLPRRSNAHGADTSKDLFSAGAVRDILIIP
jgi:hypothetical protein